MSETTSTYLPEYESLLSEVYQYILSEAWGKKKDQPVITTKPAKKKDQDAKHPSPKAN